MDLLMNLPIIDWNQAIHLSGNKRDLAEEMLALLIKGLPNDISHIHQAYKTKKYTELVRLVHKLHGALCYCGIPRLKAVISHLETDLKNNIMDSLPPLIDLLDIEVNLLLESYSSHNTKPQGLTSSSNENG